MKKSLDIVKFGKPKKYFDKNYQFNSLDLETIDNELFFIGIIESGIYKSTMTNFNEFCLEYFIRCVKTNHDILTWSKYDNTFIIKSLLSTFKAPLVKQTLERIGKVTPIVSFVYGTFTFEITNIIRMCIMMTIKDKHGNRKKLTIYNLKNLFDGDLETTAKDYGLNYYSKMGKEYHIIDRKRFETDTVYQNNVILSNQLDNKVLIDIANKLIDNFVTISGVLPKTIISAGSLARSYLLARKSDKFNFSSIYRRIKKDVYDKLLDYSMQSYHGGKIESYVLGYIKTAKAVDITSAYPYALRDLPMPTKNVVIGTDESLIACYFYVFINCTITIKDSSLIHPISIPSPMNSSNISPYGTFNAIITKPEYEYLLEKGVSLKVHDFVAVSSTDEYPYRDMIDDLFNKRRETKNSNLSLSGLYKAILTSLYGITYELNDVYELSKNKTEWMGYRAGDFFNPIIASYITAYTRTYLSRVSQNIIENAGHVYLNMTDSIIYDGVITLDVFSDVKTLGKFEHPETISDVIILGAGRYEYKNDFNDMYMVKSRGFNVKIKNKSFYQDLNLSKSIKLKHKTFVTFFKALSENYGFDKLGHLIDDEYIINPFNLGGKRIIDNYNIDLKREFTTTHPIKMEILEY